MERRRVYETGHRDAADKNLALAYKAWADPELRVWVPTLLFYAVVQLSQFLLLNRARWTAVPGSHETRRKALVKSLMYTDAEYVRLQTLSSYWRYWALEPTRNEMVEALQLAREFAEGLGVAWAVEVPPALRIVVNKMTSKRLPPGVQEAVARTVSATLSPESP